MIREIKRLLKEQGYNNYTTVVDRGEKKVLLIHDTKEIYISYSKRYDIYTLTYKDRGTTINKSTSDLYWLIQDIC